ncbi:hypothetical protein LTR36_001323 [Oleoguttula mirabilis]|uniref:Uncharacterized protein n=1 Tax=Oleoguttula mirabilis TaxID=1507867 RepID=A0AAV9JQ24_9PEZI|nr:hypothetical protein LTR36_001323 [Oleoguttula mirabilis]
MYEEARAVLYGHNVFTLRFTNLFDYYNMWAWTRRLQPDTFACLRRLYLTMSTIVELPCATKSLDYSRRVHFTHKPAFWHWRRQQHSSHSYQLVEAYRANVELTIDFSRQEATYSQVNVFEAPDSYMERPCHPSSELVAAANDGTVLSLPTEYAVSGEPSMRQFGEIVGRFTANQDDVPTPEFLPRLLAGEVEPADLADEEWQRWVLLLVELAIINGPSDLHSSRDDPRKHRHERERAATHKHR